MNYPMNENTIVISETNYDGPHIRIPNSRSPTYRAGDLSVSIPRHNLIEKIEDNIMDVMQAYNKAHPESPIYDHWKICWEEATATLFVIWVGITYPQYANKEFENILRSQC